MTEQEALRSGEQQRNTFLRNCVKYHFSNAEILAMISGMHGKSDQEREEIARELNKKIEEGTLDIESYLNKKQKPCNKRENA